MKYYNYDYTPGKLIGCKVVGHGNRTVNKEIYNALEFYASKLFTEKALCKCYFYISIKNKLDDKALGYCLFNNDFLDPEFDIEILNTKNLDEMLSTLAHEMIHAKQFYKKELKYDYPFVIWKKEKLILEEVKNKNEEWELEAYDLENKLLQLYKERFHDKQRQQRKREA